MYDYDQVAWHGSDAVNALRVALKDTTRFAIEAYVAEQTPDGWRLLYGELSPARDTFRVSYEATRGSVDTTYTARHIVPARADAGQSLAAARAALLARTTFGSIERPYNTIVIPQANQWLAYMLPASTDAGWVLGADTRYLVSADGQTVLNARRLHNGIMEFPMTRPGQAVPVSGVHTDVRDNVPEDSDVFFVLTRMPRIPEIVATEVFVYRIDATGHVRCSGRTESLRRR